MTSVFDELYQTSRDPLYPMGKTRDENIMVEFNGILHSESERVFYGLEGCPVLDIHPFETYKRLLSLQDPDRVYEEIAYFRPHRLIQYLNDGNKIPEDEVNAILDYANLNYDFSTATFINMAGTIKSLFQYPAIKNVTIVLPDQTENNLVYLSDILDPKNIKEKCNFIVPDNDQTIMDAMKEELKRKADDNNPYTTVITNEYQLILDVLRDYKTYKADTTLFLLRNHSENTEQVINGDSVWFQELHNTEILGAINGDVNKSKLENLDFPVKAKFGRFKPFPYSTGSPSFMTY